MSHGTESGEHSWECHVEKAQKISNPFKQWVISEFQKEVKRKNFSCENEFYLHENKKSFSYQ